jgi:CheY-like chemotaxis protein
MKRFERGYERRETRDVSHPEAGRPGCSLEAVSLARAVRDVLVLVEPLAARANVRLAADFGGLAQGSHVRADRQGLDEVLLSLVSNAIRYDHIGGSVDVSFSSGGASRTRVLVAGTEIVETPGLGLSLPRRLVDAMGGSITVESEPGGGSTRVVELEAADASSAESVIEIADAMARERQAGRSGVTCRVLCIEDNLASLTRVARILDRQPDIQLLSAMHGRLGLCLACEYRPDVILVDVDLPDMAGQEVLWRLKADELTRRIPVIVVGPDANRMRVERLVSLGASEYLTRPLDVRRFLEVVAGTLGPAARS